MIEANKFKLGIFITVGIATIIIGIFIFGISQYFTEEISLYTVFTDEVEGLAIGAPVKFNGVTLGTVSDIYICEQGNIEVQMVLSLSSIRKKIKTPLGALWETNRELLKEVDRLVHGGLRCSLQWRGITGEKCIRLAYYKGTSNRENLRLASADHDCYYIPSVPSYLGSAIDNIGKLLEDLSKIDFNSLVQDLDKNLQSLTKISNNVDTLSKADFKGAIDSLSKNLHIVGRLSEKIEKTLAHFNVEELNSSLLNTMNKLDEMSSSLTSLSNNIDNNPSSIVWGRKEKKILKNNSPR